MELKTCPGCGFVTGINRNDCGQCGHIYKKPKKPISGCLIVIMILGAMFAVVLVVSLAIEFVNGSDWGDSSTSGGGGSYTQCLRDGGFYEYQEWDELEAAWEVSDRCNALYP